MTPRNDFEVETAKGEEGKVWELCSTPKERSAEGYTGKSVEWEGVLGSELLLKCKEGLCAAHQDNPKQPRNRKWYLKNIIAPMIERGEIDDGTKTPFDDRKLRYHESRLSGKLYTTDGFSDDQPTIWELSLVTSLGITNFKAFLADVNRSDEENHRLQERGLQEFGERWAYFARAPGVAVLPINQDGTIFIGERANKEYGGFLNAVAGHLTYKNDVAEIDIPKEAFRELREEFGIYPEEVSYLRFTGLYSHPAKGDLDFTFLAEVAKPEGYFSSGEWKKSVKEREHKDLVRLATIAEINELLETGKVPGSDRTLKLMYSTRGALQAITPYHIKN